MVNKHWSMTRWKAWPNQFQSTEHDFLSTTKNGLFLFSAPKTLSTLRKIDLLLKIYVKRYIYTQNRICCALTHEWRGIAWCVWKILQTSLCAKAHLAVIYCNIPCGGISKTLNSVSLCTSARWACTCAHAHAGPLMTEIINCGMCTRAHIIFYSAVYRDSRIFTIVIKIEIGSKSVFEGSN